MADVCYRFLTAGDSHTGIQFYDELKRGRPYWALVLQTSDPEKAEYDALIRKGSFDVLWADAAFYPHGVRVVPLFSALPKSPRAQYQIVSRFACTTDVASTTGLMRTLEDAYGSQQACFDVMPATFVFQGGVDARVGSDAWQAFMRRAVLVSNGLTECIHMQMKHCVNNIWLLKPTTCVDAFGIRFFKDLSQLRSFLWSAKGEWVAQKYIERPLLLAGRKFSLRVFVLVTDTGDVYTYRHGYLSTSSHDFVSTMPPDANEDEQFVRTHLTTHALQTAAPEFGSREPHNILYFDVLQQFLDAHTDFPMGCVDSVIVPRIRRVVADVMMQAAPAMVDGNAGRRCFQLFGADFVVDEDLKPWLIGFSDSPLARPIASPTFQKFISTMLSELVDLVVAPLFPPTHTMTELWRGLPSEGRGAASGVAASGAGSGAGKPAGGTAAPPPPPTASNFRKVCTVPGCNEGRPRVRSKPPAHASAAKLLVTQGAAHADEPSGLGWWDEGMGLPDDAVLPTTSRVDRGAPSADTTAAAAHVDGAADAARVPMFCRHTASSARRSRHASSKARSLSPTRRRPTAHLSPVAVPGSSRVVGPLAVAPPVLPPPQPSSAASAVGRALAAAVPADPSSHTPATGAGRKPSVMAVSKATLRAIDLATSQAASSASYSQALSRADDVLSKLANPDAAGSVKAADVHRLGSALDSMLETSPVRIPGSSACTPRRGVASSTSATSPASPTSPAGRVASPRARASSGSDVPSHMRPTASSQIRNAAPPAMVSYRPSVHPPRAPNSASARAAAAARGAGRTRFNAAADSPAAVASSSPSNGHPPPSRHRRSPPSPSSPGSPRGGKAQPRGAAKAPPVRAPPSATTDNARTRAKRRPSPATPANTATPLAPSATNGDAADCGSSPAAPAATVASSVTSHPSDEEAHARALAKAAVNAELQMLNSRAATTKGGHRLRPSLLVTAVAPSPQLPPSVAGLMSDKPPSTKQLLTWSGDVLRRWGVRQPRVGSPERDAADAARAAAFPAIGEAGASDAASGTAGGGGDTGSTPPTKRRYRPSQHLWVAVPAAGGNKPYFYNSITRETTWSRPSDDKATIVRLDEFEEDVDGSDGGVGVSAPTT